MNYECKVCGNSPDDEGNLNHGRGCFTQSEEGGGWEYIEAADKRVRLCTIFGCEAPVVNRQSYCQAHYDQQRAMADAKPAEPAPLDLDAIVDTGAKGSEYRKLYAEARRLSAEVKRHQIRADENWAMNAVMKKNHDAEVSRLAAERDAAVKLADERYWEGEAAEINFDLWQMTRSANVRVQADKDRLTAEVERLKSCEAFAEVESRHYEELKVSRAEVERLSHQIDEQVRDKNRISHEYEQHRQALEARLAEATARAEEPKPATIYAKKLASGGYECGLCGRYQVSHAAMLCPKCGTANLFQDAVPIQPAAGDWVEVCVKDLEERFNACECGECDWCYMFGDQRLEALADIIRRHAPQESPRRTSANCSLEEQLEGKEKE